MGQDENNIYPTKSYLTLKCLEELNRVCRLNNFPNIKDVQLHNDAFNVSLNNIDWYPVNVVCYSEFYAKEKQKVIHKIGLLRKSLEPDWTVDEVYDDHYLTIDIYKINTQEKYESYCNHKVIIAMQDYNNPSHDYFCHADSSFNYEKELIESYHDINHYDFLNLRQLGEYSEWQWIDSLRRFSFYNRLLRNGCIEVSPFKYGDPNDWTDPEHTYGIKA